MAMPFFEHPTGAFETAVDAMADAVGRLRGMGPWREWITFCAQGEGEGVETHHMARIRLRGEMMELEEHVEVAEVVKLARVPEGCLRREGIHYSVGKASAREQARMMDVIFRRFLGIKPHRGEADYAVGAEW